MWQLRTPYLVLLWAALLAVLVESVQERDVTSVALVLVTLALVEIHTKAEHGRLDALEERVQRLEKGRP